jgi:hypothetical protein
MTTVILRQVKDWANSKNCDVEIKKGKYQVWNKNDESTVDLCDSLQEVVNSVAQLGEDYETTF